MKEPMYKSYKELLLFFKAEMVAQALGVLLSSGYGLMHQQDFLLLKIVGWIVELKVYIIQWVAKSFFSLPNKNFFPTLSHGALAFYYYLLYCEDCGTYQC